MQTNAYDRVHTVNDVSIRNILYLDLFTNWGTGLIFILKWYNIYDIYFSTAFNIYSLQFILKLS